MKKFSLVLVRPSHYDDDGYVIQWFRSSMPSNSLACIYGLAIECAKEKVLGKDVKLDIHVFDEVNTHINPEKIASLIESADDGMLMLVGVQSNQFPRALDIAKPLRAKGIKVAVGGFHVSGMLSMGIEYDSYMQTATNIGVSLFAGEAEGRFDQVLIDASNNQIKPVYNFLDNLPDIGNTAIPFLPIENIFLTSGFITSFDTGRGCPFTCSFCTIINVQGQTSRYRSVRSIENIIRLNVKKGLSLFLISDDNFARNKNWEVILDKFIELREVDNLKINFRMQVDALCNNLPGFIEKAGRAGVKMVFIGLENINSDNLISVNKVQNKLSNYRKMLLSWKNAGVITYCGYILGFPTDTQESILRDIEIIKKELPLDLLEFTYLAPLPGAENYKQFCIDKSIVNKDLNAYDLTHLVISHPSILKENAEKTYYMAWDSYFSYSHIKTIIKRSIETSINITKLIDQLVWDKGCTSIEKVHPAEGGFLRCKIRKNRRPILPIESPFIFYPKYFLETIWKQCRWALLVLKIRLIGRKVLN